MKKVVLAFGVLFLLFAVSVVSPSCGMRSKAKGADTLKVNTTELGKSVIGFNGQTPVEISVCQGVITEIKALPNHESPAFLQRVLDSGLLKVLIGKTVEEAKATELDAVSGATYTSEALIQNIRLGLDTL
jgi:electron transport complex protein RnfG